VPRASEDRFLTLIAAKMCEQTAQWKNFSRSRRSKVDEHDFGTTTSHARNVIFFLTSFFNNSIHQLVATNERCKIFHENGRENRNHGNQEKGKEEKALSNRNRQQ
jgi:hypothetical protein